MTTSMTTHQRVKKLLTAIRITVGRGRSIAICWKLLTKVGTALIMMSATTSTAITSVKTG